MKRRRKLRRTLVACLTMVLLLSGPAGAVVSSNTGDNPPWTGTYINDYLGADTFYNNGYTGSRSIVANIEAGHVWDGHQTLGHVNTFINDALAAGEYDRHATYVGHAIAGRGSVHPEIDRGIAYGADLWSGAIASSWNGTPYMTNFNMYYASIYHAYGTSMSSGVAGQTADVINSSWGNSSDTVGDGIPARYLDAIVNTTSKTAVMSAGNSGPAGNTVGAPASAFNTIAVAALASDTSSPLYDDVSSFSSRSPSDFFLPSNASGSGGRTIDDVRAAVDIAAPGQNLTLAYYGGTTGGNTGGTDITGGSGTYFSSNAQGTSFAAPLVAGGAALVADVGHDQFSGGESIDGRVIKAVLMNSADKTTLHPWDNGQQNVGGVITTTQSLDWTVGAGRMDLDGGYHQYLDGTTNVAGLGGGTVLPVGWDYGQVAESAANEYFIDRQLTGGTYLTATLSWFVDRSFNTSTHSGSYDSFDDLNLEVWSASAAGVLLDKIAESISQYNTSEHLHFLLPDDGYYAIRVVWDSEVYDFVGDADQELFGLAWSSVPEPATVVMMLTAAVPFALRRRRRR